MTDAGWFRANTQIILSEDALGDYRNELEQMFMITVVDEGDSVRLIGSPVVITDVRNWLTSKEIIVD